MTTKSTKQPAQILVMTLLLLVVISLTVVSITAVTMRNSNLVSSNLEYQRALNNSETLLLDTLPMVSAAGVSLNDLSGTDINGLRCSELSNGRIICSDQPGNDLRRVLNMFETNEVVGYTLGVGEYFDIILQDTNSTNNYTGLIDISWSGNSALDLSLIYRTADGRLRQEKQLVNNTNTFNSTGSGLFNSPPRQVNANSVQIDMSDVNSARVPSNSSYRYLRVKSVSRSIGTTINIIPDTTAGSFPNQLRQIESFSYNPEQTQGATPIIFTQIPLSPKVPEVMGFGFNTNAVAQPVCGDGIVQAGEDCDPPGLTCPANCRCEIDFVSARFNTTQNMGSDCAGAEGRGISRDDNSIEYSRNDIELCIGGGTKLRWGGNRLLDDLLILIPAGERLDVTGLEFTLPENHLIIAPVSGFLNGAEKTIKVEGTSKRYSFSYDNIGNITEIRRAGFNTSTFEQELDVQTLQNLNFIEDGIARFRLVHIAAGCGFADARLEVRR